MIEMSKSFAQKLENYLEDLGKARKKSLIPESEWSKLGPVGAEDWLPRCGACNTVMLMRGGCKFQCTRCGFMQSCSEGLNGGR